MFRLRSMLTPVTCLKFAKALGLGRYRYTRELFIFGVRVAYWTVSA